MSLFANAKSADVFTVVVALATLFPLFGSLVLDDTPALFVSVPLVPAFTLTVAVISALLPALSVPRLHGNTDPGQLPWLVVKVVRETPLGSVSVTVTLVAFDGPRFVAVRT